MYEHDSHRLRNFVEGVLFVLIVLLAWKII